MNKLKIWILITQTFYIFLIETIKIIQTIGVPGPKLLLLCVWDVLCPFSTWPDEKTPRGELASPWGPSVIVVLTYEISALMRDFCAYGCDSRGGAASRHIVPQCLVNPRFPPSTSFGFIQSNTQKGAELVPARVLLSWAQGSPSSQSPFSWLRSQSLRATAMSPPTPPRGPKQTHLFHAWLGSASHQPSEKDRLWGI